MPLLKLKSKKAERVNFLELMHGPVGPARQKAIRTLMRRRRISYEEARRQMAYAIAESIRRGRHKRRR